MMTLNDTAAIPTIHRPRTDDRYPSRFGREVLISRRLDPVVWGEPGQGPLSETQLHSYTDHGSLHFDTCSAPTRCRPALTRCSDFGPMRPSRTWARP